MTITAYFGEEDLASADLLLAEGADVCALAGGVPGLAAIVILETADNIVLTGSVILPTLTATLPLVEHADNCALSAIAPTSIIGHGKKFHVKPHDPKSIVIPSS